MSDKIKKHIVMTNMDNGTVVDFTGNYIIETLDWGVVEIDNANMKSHVGEIHISESLKPREVNITGYYVPSSPSTRDVATAKATLDKLTLAGSKIRINITENRDELDHELDIAYMDVYPATSVRYSTDPTYNSPAILKFDMALDALDPTFIRFIDAHDRIGEVYKVGSSDPYETEEIFRWTADNTITFHDFNTVDKSWGTLGLYISHIPSQYTDINVSHIKITQTKNGQTYSQMYKVAGGATFHTFDTSYLDLDKMTFNGKNLYVASNGGFQNLTMSLPNSVLTIEFYYPNESNPVTGNPITNINLADGVMRVLEV